ncbi:MAG: hypothetical protein AAB546_04475 [Patescibacteria group bacterium]
MHQLAVLFVSFVSLVNSLSPKTDLPKILGVAVNPSNAAVLSSTDEKESGQSARLKRLNQLKSLQEKTKESTTEGKVKEKEFKTKVAQIEDTKKQQIVLKIDANIVKLNQKWLAQWEKTLERLSQLLTKIEARGQTLSSQGKDTTDLQTAIESAKQAIEDAEVKLAEQAVKTYIVEITEEKNLGLNVKTTINTFHNDIRNTKESIQIAKKAVTKALASLKEISAKEESNDE